MKKIYTEYADLKLQAKEIEDKMKALQPKIIADMQEQGETSLSNEAGKFSVRTYTNWAYSDKVDVQKAKLVKLQEKEQIDGTAKKTETTSLTFNPPKND